jgi:hypothetical protein
MSPTMLTNSPVWTTAGWTMLHLLWVGVVIGLVAALARRLLRPIRPEARYGVALLCLLALAISPAAIFVRVFERVSRADVALIRAIQNSKPASSDSTAISKRLRAGRPESLGQPLDPPVSDSTRWRRVS